MVAVFLIILVVAAGITYYLTTPTTTTTQTPITSTTTPTTSDHAQPRITDVTPEGFVFVDGEIYWRFEVSGEVDLRDKVTINGVYGWWFGVIDVTLPNGERTNVFVPPNYVDILTMFQSLSGSEVFDAYVLDVDAWWEKSFLDGTYRVVVWLKGPYENKSVLFDKSFDYRMDCNISVTPTVWASWNESLEIAITNTGDVPLVLQGVGIVWSGTGSVAGDVSISREVIMPGESKEIVAPVYIFEDFRAYFKGKTIALDFVFNFAGARQEYIEALNVSFPAE